MKAKNVTKSSKEERIIFFDEDEENMCNIHDDGANAKGGCQKYEHK